MTDFPPQYPGPPGAGGSTGGHPSSGYEPTQSSGPGTRAIVIAIVLAVVVVVGGIGVAIALTGGDDTTTQGQSGSPSASPSPSSGGSSSSTSSSTTTSSSTSTSSSATPNPTETTTTTSTGTGNTYFAQLAAHDLAGLKALACPGTTINLTQTQIDQVTAAVPDGAAVETGDNNATMNGTVTANDGSSADVSAYLVRLSSSWCLDRTKSA